MCSLWTGSQVGFWAKIKSASLERGWNREGDVVCYGWFMVLISRGSAGGSCEIPCDHVCQNNHIMNWEEIEIVEQESDKFKRWIKESICIRFNAPNMNRDEGAYQLSPIWTQVISTPQPGGRSRRGWRLQSDFARLSQLTPSEAFFWHLWRFSSFDKDGWQSSKLSASVRFFLGYVVRTSK